MMTSAGLPNRMFSITSPSWRGTKAILARHQTETPQFINIPAIHKLTTNVCRLLDMQVDIQERVRSRMPRDLIVSPLGPSPGR